MRNRRFSFGPKRFGAKLPGIVALVLCLGAGAAHGQRVTASVSADSVTVGQRFFLTLLVDHAATERPVFPDEAAAEIDTTTGHVRLGDLEILARAAYVTRPLDDRFVRDSLVYEVATFALDTAFVPPVPVHFTADADTLTAASEPFFVPVISLVPADAQDIRDLAPPAEFPRPMWPWALLGAVALMLAALAVYYRRARAPEAPPPVTAAPAPPASPYQEAVERLRRLESLDPATGKPYYVELSETLRTYLSRRLGVSAMEETTSELVYELKRYAERGQVTEAVVDEVHAVLELADFVKFADARPPAPRGRKALARARTAVQTVETRWATPPERMMGTEGTGASPDAPPAGGDALPSRPSAAPGPPPKRRFRPAVVAGGVVGAATAFYGGLVNLPPLALAFVYALVVRRLTPPSRRPLADTLAIQAGLYTWLLVGYVLAPELVAAPWLASVFMLAVVLGLAWLMIRPGWLPALALGLVHAFALAVEAPGLLEAVWGSPAHRALAVDVVLRLAALVTMALGVRAVRAERDASDALPSRTSGA
jgi:hypothetical protein